MASAETQAIAGQYSPRRVLFQLGVGALGVVYGDIGTSPLYTIRECFNPAHGLSPSTGNILGVLSLVFWALMLVVGLKYLTFVMRADNNGEGGILALLALVTSPHRGKDQLDPRDRSSPQHARLVLLALLGTSLLFADGMITPAISVLSAVEGLETTAHGLHPLTVPLTVFILLMLFLLQSRGTARVGALFGPVMMLWFSSTAALGLSWIIRHPSVLLALSPVHAVRLFEENGWHGFLVLGGVVLAVTGTEALYADMGHFGRRPIRLTWFTMVFPALVLNYLGQGAVLVERGQAAVANPFYSLAPEPLLLPLIALSTAATIIASQALISGSFSLARQAVQLGYFPRLAVVHTSSRAPGQIFVPKVNWLLMLACTGLVLIFQTSTNLAAAYGISVMGTMVMTSILLFEVMRQRWRWSLPSAAGLVAVFLFVDLALLFSNISKLVHGAMVPLVVGGTLFAVLTTWKRGRREVARQLQAFLPLDEFLPSLTLEPPVRVRGTAVFLTSTRDVVPQVLLHHFKHNKVLHGQVIILSVETQEVPEVPEEHRVQVQDRGQGFYQVVARYGFMQSPDVPRILKSCERAGLRVNPAETSYYLGRETLLTSGRSGLARWRKALFAFLSRNASPATHFFGIPPNRVVELGAQIQI